MISTSTPFTQSRFFSKTPSSLRKSTLTLTLTLPSLSSSLSSSPSLNFQRNPNFTAIRACSVPNSPNPHPFQKLKTYAGAAVLIGTSLAFIFNPNKSLARAEPAPPAPALSEQFTDTEGSKSPESKSFQELKLLLQQKLENREDQEALEILKGLVSAYPESRDWKFMLARLYGEMGDTQNARDMFEKILEEDPLCFEALFENALLMDQCGEGEHVMKRLEEALRIAEDEDKPKEGRDVRLIMAQMEFLQKNVEGALKSYQDLVKEDPSDFRPYFCQGMIYSLLDRNVEAREQFAKYHELLPKDKQFEVEGFLRTPLSRMKLFEIGTDNVKEGSSHI